jgi:SAM-dependent methyltransferase
VKKKENTKEIQLRELENQLSCPSGKYGIQVGKDMHASNISMTSNSIDYLGLKKGHFILELGHGNCGHLNRLLDVAKDIKYFGLEISKTMFLEAKKKQTHHQAIFKLYDGIKLPYPDTYFDRIMSVNTIYFWSNPRKLFLEISRILKPNGYFILTFAKKDFMQDLPFVGNKFKLYDKEDIETILKEIDLKIIQNKDLKEFVKSKTGEKVERHYTLLKLAKDNS